MKLTKMGGFVAILLAVAACGSTESEKNQNELTDALNELKEELNDTSGPAAGWLIVDTDPFFSVEIPAHMKVETTLNEGANLQYSYIERIGDITKEHYVIVMMEDLDSIEDYDKNDAAFSIEAYGEYASNELGAGLDEYEILTSNAVVEDVNGLECMRYEMTGGLGSVNVYYQLGVFKGERGFYQILTWTIDNQKAEFKADMDRIISSFVEKPAI